MSSRAVTILSASLVLCGATIAAVYVVQAQRETGQPDGAPAPAMLVYKTPTCGCCSKWVDHIRAAGFDVRATDVSQAELDEIKAQHGVPREMSSCHTGIVDGYVVEGHIPAAEVRRFLKQRPAVAGLAVPGMPLGSPGMEVEGARPRPYNVFTFDRAGQMQVFTTVTP